MNKLEYIPGDLVMTETLPNNFMPNGIVCKFVKYCDNNEVLIRAANTAINIGAERKRIVPIPIIPELLEKNGWNREKGIPFTYTKKIHKGNTKSFYTIIEYINKPGIFSIRHGRDNHFLCDVTYIHQLQHLLFGLGLNHEMEV